MSLIAINKIKKTFFIREKGFLLSDIIILYFFTGSFEVALYTVPGA